MFDSLVTMLSGDLDAIAADGPARAAQLAAAVLCGSMIGYDRARRSPAGVKTCVFVCLGATLYMHTGAVLVEGAGDPGRMAGQIATGIGFLGAGTILREGGGVHGLTTAATIWFLGAVGVLIGSGFPISAMLISAIAVVLLKTLTHFEGTILPDPRKREPKS
ncbi:MAG: MgtC/SapB family protein [Deltaproteobacteria bacterium]|nr:MAG: MgtC/SapB family protein [Deltaproteobacteria bacterium]